MFSIFLILAFSSAWAEPFQYFDQTIDYWKEGKASEPSVPSTFNWKLYMDPESTEFFKEGEHVPPEPFMEIVRNPSDENMKNWFAYIDKKNELATRLETRMKEFTAQHPNIPMASFPQTHPAAKQFRFRMYSRSTCPYCQQMKETLRELQSMGFAVEVRSLDTVEKASPFPMVMATASEIKSIDSVPLLLVGDLKSQKVYRLKGFQTTQEIFSFLQTH